MHSFFDTIPEESRMFPEFFSLYLNEFDSRLSVLSNEGSGIISFNGIYGYLYTNLLNYSIRTLIKELHDYKNKNLLTGETPRERFVSFEKIIENEHFMTHFYEKYPVLKLLLEQKIRETVLYVNEIIINFKNDKIELERKFKVKFKKIIDIHLGKGDTHNGGKSVAIIEFDSGKIVYKPHSLSPDIVFKNIIDWVNSKDVLKCNLNSLKVIDYDNYGWQEFISYGECKSYIEVENYYYRAGCFLAIFYTLGTNDIHFENIIVNGEHPYFIDLETLVGISNPGQIDSVLTSGFIPNRSSNNLFDMDLSGLCGKMQISSKLKTMAIANPKTDEMIVETQPARIYSNNNIVRLNSEIVKVEEYTSNFIKGFQDAIELIIDNKNSYIRLIEKEFNEFQKFRQVIRHTQVYAKFLIAASHPDYLKNEDKHVELFQRLYNGCKDDLKHKRISNEISTLLKWDIPYYYCYYDSKDLLSDNILIHKDYFQSTIKKSLYTRIEKINSNVKNFQIDIIKKSLFTVYEDKFMNKEFNRVKFCSNNSDLNKEIIMKIANSISSNALDLKETDKIAFLINTTENNQVLLANINFNLYEGGGIIWLFACLGKLFDNNNYENISMKLLESSVLTYEYYDMKQTNLRRLTAFSGIGSLMYLYYNMSVLYDNEDYYLKFTNIANKILEYNCDYLKTSNKSLDYDFVCGISGILVLAAKIYLNEKNYLMEKIIDIYSDYLLKYINNNNLNKIGLAHGLSGYSLALIMIYRVKKDRVYLDLATKLINKENLIYSSNGKTDEFTTSWCNGETGMALVRNEMLKIEHNSKMLNDTLKYLQIIITNGFYNMNSMCLCHGIYGNIEIVNQIINNIDETHKIITNDEVKKFETSLINNLSDIQLGLKNNFMLDTFMLGSSGIAYAKLRYLYPQIPSILSLDIIERNCKHFE
ncbi:type 2 lanthipeptide synthetase LanM [Clostridium estertheticum]|uniref:type 2 lanthipeptide synthetase LanM n=1 Tax=Clostridium estertheticum TaxID=238834 RepID=UPI001CF56AAB|nr:type 2 lanthipeptide synthetase LanM [Clostridium estertheticum]MCB2357161.1 type 2 lantipeptide synthetase LanM [Clostridium estertheticum]WAG44050.1 type 2 lantipeptide synthetase LanM [Clostridium estertheticum]